MINQPDLIDILATSFDEKQAMALAHAMSHAVEQGNKEMAPLKDLEVIAAKADASIAREFRSFTVWNAGVIFTAAGLVIAAMKLF